jgi:hypothetical protein
MGPGGGGALFLNFEDMVAPGRTRPQSVYLNLPPGADPKDHPDLLVDVLPTFGLAEASRAEEPHLGRGISYTIDATEVIKRLQGRNAWDPNDVRITLVSREGGLPEAGPPPPIQVGRISVSLVA